MFAFFFFSAGWIGKLFSLIVSNPEENREKKRANRGKKGKGKASGELNITRRCWLMKDNKCCLGSAHLFLSFFLSCLLLFVLARTKESPTDNTDSFPFIFDVALGACGCSYLRI